nr:restriction endonuclease [Pseudopedobacter sp.]
ISRKSIGIFGERKVETNYDLESLDDIYQYSQELEKAVGNYLG